MLAARANLLRRLALTALLLLAALLLARYLWLAPPPQLSSRLSPWLPLALTLAPLAAVARGMLAARRYTVAWSGFLALGYFAFGVDSLFIAGASRWLGVGEIGASLLWFFASALYVRGTAPARQSAASPGS